MRIRIHENREKCDVVLETSPLLRMPGGRKPGLALLLYHCFWIFCYVLVCE